MSGVTWSKFFWSDWDTDPALKLCGLAAQGLWMRMLCIAASHDPIGYVAVAGRPISVTDLARLTGVSETDVVSLLGELDRNGVCSRDRHGRYYSRRMVRDARKASTARKNGKLGGNPTLCSKTGNPLSDNPQVKAWVKPQEPEARSQKSPDANASDAAASFDPLSDLRGLEPKRRAWACAKRLLVDRGKLSEAAAGTFVGKLMAAGKLGKLEPDDLWTISRDGWLNGTEDPRAYLTAAARRVLERRAKPDKGANVDAWTESTWSIAVEAWLSEARWSTSMGPHPGQPGCRVPQCVFEKMAPHLAEVSRQLGQQSERIAA